MAERALWRELTVAPRHRRQRDSQCAECNAVSAVSWGSEHSTLVLMTPRVSKKIVALGTGDSGCVAGQTFILDVL